MAYFEEVKTEDYSPRNVYISSVLSLHKGEALCAYSECYSDWREAGETDGQFIERCAGFDFDDGDGGAAVFQSLYEQCIVDETP